MIQRRKMINRRERRQVLEFQHMISDAHLQDVRIIVPIFIWRNNRYDCVLIKGQTDRDLTLVDCIARFPKTQVIHDPF